MCHVAIGRVDIAEHPGRRIGSQAILGGLLNPHTYKTIYLTH